MPQPGYQSITVKQAIYDKFIELAKKNKRSPAKQLEWMLENW